MALYKLRIWSEPALAARPSSNKDKHTFPLSTFFSLGNRTMGNSPYRTHDILKSFEIYFWQRTDMSHISRVEWGDCFYFYFSCCLLSINFIISSSWISLLAFSWLLTKFSWIYLICGFIVMIKERQTFFLSPLLFYICIGKY